MSELREAAALMRHRARIGGPREYPSPWSVRDMDIDSYGLAATVSCADNGDVTDALDQDVADYLAAVHPPFLLLIADWLDEVADRAERVPKQYRAAKHAKAVARAYLASGPGR